MKKSLLFASVANSQKEITQIAKSFKEDYGNQIKIVVKNNKFIEVWRLQ